MVAVGDTNEVFLFDVSHGSGQYSLTHVFHGATDASFSTDWSPNGQQFAVASQDGTVSVFDVRSLPPGGAAAGELGGKRPPKRVAEIRSLQPRTAGAARKVKFSPSSGGGGTPLLGFTEVSGGYMTGCRRVEEGCVADAVVLGLMQHRSLFHVVDARTFESMQTIDVPAVFAQTAGIFPRQPWGGDEAGAEGSTFDRTAGTPSQRTPRWAYYRPLSGSGPGLVGGGASRPEYMALVPDLPGGAGSRTSVPLPSDTVRMEVRVGGGGGREEGSGMRWQTVGGEAGQGPVRRGGAWGIAMGAAAGVGGGDRTAQVWLMGPEAEGDERDLVGFDWHEDGTGGVVALGKGVVEWEVDLKAGRCSGTWAYA